MNPIKFITDPIKAAALRIAKQAGAAREFAELKARRQFKREKSEKLPYEPGTIGLSAVSEAILNDYGHIMSRRERRALAKQQGVPFRAYYNGDGQVIKNEG